MNELFRRLLFLPEQASTFAVKVDHLHYFVIGVTIIASTAIGLGSLLLFVRYRRRGEGPTANFHTNVWAESAIVGIPLAFFLLWFWMGFRDYVTLSKPPANSIDVYVSAKQWMWEFSYPDGPNAIATLKVPAHRPVRLLMTSRDVIHSFFVPQFRLKQDVLPGRYTQTWFEATKTGTFEILCAEYCGLQHSLMRGTVEVVEPAEWDAWLADQRKGIAAREDAGRHPGEPVRGDLASEGQRLSAELGCFRCHTTDGTPHIGPTWLDLYRRREPLAGGGEAIADEAYLTESMMDPMAKVVAGYKPVMPTYQGKVEGPQTAAILEFIKSLRSERPVPERSGQLIPGASGGAPAPLPREESTR